MRTDANGDIYANRVNSTGDIVSGWTANGTIICNAGLSQDQPKLCSDGSGGAIIVWVDNRDSNTDIYAQRINSSGVVKWTSNGVVICDLTSVQNQPVICSDGAGGAIISWRDFRNSNGDIFAQHINSTGGVEWTANGVEVCTYSTTQSVPRLVSDDAGGVIITWDDLRNSNQDIYAQRINSTGGVEWTVDGVAICVTGNMQTNPELISDGSEGAIITWIDYRTGSANIYVQKISSGGVVQWSTNGYAVCTAVGAQQFPRICTDGSGGAYIAWSDSRSGTKAYVMYITSNGDNATGWTLGGISVSNLADEISNPKICEDGVGGAIIAFDQATDSAKNGGSPYHYCYAQRVAPNGSFYWGDSGAALSNSNNQTKVEISFVDRDRAIAVWIDDATPSDTDIFAQYLEEITPKDEGNGGGGDGTGDGDPDVPPPDATGIIIVYVVVGGVIVGIVVIVVANPDFIKKLSGRLRE